MSDGLVWLWVLGNILGENVLWSINISAEHEVIDLSNVTLVQVLSNEELEKLFAWWDEGKLLHHSSELLGGDMTVLSSIVILQLWLD